MATQLTYFFTWVSSLKPVQMVMKICNNNISVGIYLMDFACIRNHSHIWRKLRLLRIFFGLFTTCFLVDQGNICCVFPNGYFKRPLINSPYYLSNYIYVQKNVCNTTEYANVIHVNMHHRHGLNESISTLRFFSPFFAIKVRPIRSSSCLKPWTW